MMSKKLNILCGVIFFALAVFLLAPVTITCPIQTETQRANAEMHAISTALKLFELDVGRYPTEEEGLEILWNTQKALGLIGYKKFGYLTEPFKDPWGNNYQYLIDKQLENNFKLWSFGNPSKKNGVILYKDTK